MTADDPTSVPWNGKNASAEMMFRLFSQPSCAGRCDPCCFDCWIAALIENEQYRLTTPPPGGFTGLFGFLG